MIVLVTFCLFEHFIVTLSKFFLLILYDIFLLPFNVYFSAFLKSSKLWPTLVFQFSTSILFFIALKINCGLMIETPSNSSSLIPL